MASSIIVCGIGAAQVATEMLCAWPGTSVPLEAVSGDLPAYVAAETLCVVTDFGDDDTATMRALADAEARGARVVVLTNGGTVPGTAGISSIKSLRCQTCKLLALTSY